MQGPFLPSEGFFTNSDLASPYLSPGAQELLNMSRAEFEADFIDKLPFAVQEFNRINPHRPHQYQPLNTNLVAHASQGPQQANQALSQATITTEAPSSSFRVSSSFNPTEKAKGSAVVPTANPTILKSTTALQDQSAQSGKRKRSTSGEEIGQEVPSKTVTPASSSKSTSSLSPVLSQAQDHQSDSEASTSEDEEPVAKKPRRTRASQSQGRIDAGGNGYGDDLQNRPPIGARPPPGIEIGAIEILTFFPRWLHHPDVVLRLFKAGWNRTEIAKAQLHAINRLNFGDMKRVSERVQKQVSFAGKLKTGMNGTWSNKRHLPNIADYDDLKADGWKTRHDLDPRLAQVELVDYKLADIAAPVMQGGNSPQGSDRLLLTQVLEYAHRNPNLNLTLADTGRIIQEQGFTAPGSLDKDHDAQAFQRFSRAVRTPPETSSARRVRKATQTKSRAKARRARMGGN